MLHLIICIIDSYYCERSSVVDRQENTAKDSSTIGTRVAALKTYQLSSDVLLQSTIIQFVVSFYMLSYVQYFFIVPS